MALVGVALLALVAALAFLSPTLAVALVAALVAIALTLAAPLAVLCLLPLAVAFGSLATQGVGGLHVGPTDLLLGLLAVVVFGRLLARERPAIRVYVRGLATSQGQAHARSWLRTLWREAPQLIVLFAALLAYLAIVALSIVVASSHSATLKEIIKWGEVTAAVVLTLLLARTERQVRLVAWALIVAGLAEALLGCAQWAFATGSLGPGGSSIRVFGTFGQPNPYGGYLNFALPLALSLALFGRDARERWVAAAASVILLLAEGLANSRGALIGLTAAVVIIAVLGWRRERLAISAVVFGVPLAIIAWIGQLVPQHLQNAVLNQVRVNGLTLSCAPNSGVNDANFSTVERLAHWVAGLRMFLAHPLLGVGAGNYNNAYSQYAVACWPEPLGHAHNYYINVAAETGILGLVTFLALVVAALYLGWRATHPATNGPLWTKLPNAPAARLRWLLGPAGPTSAMTSRALAIGFAAVIVALCVHNLTDDLFVHAMELQFALCLGCLLRLAALAHPRP
jgi:O-antigen ligase